jgi:hypothetical protein
MKALRLLRFTGPWMQGSTRGTIQCKSSSEEGCLVLSRLFYDVEPRNIPETEAGYNDVTRVFGRAAS